jgi:hypothetical protein
VVVQRQYDGVCVTTTRSAICAIATALSKAEGCLAGMVAAALSYQCGEIPARLRAFSSA